MSNPPITPAPAPPSKGGMPKWLILLIVIFGIITFGCCGVITTCMIVARRAAQAVSAAAPSMVKEAMNKGGINYDTSGNGIALPASFPSDVPVYSGMKATFSEAPTGGNGGGITFTGSAKPQDIGSYYASELPAKGWTQVQNVTQPDGLSQAYTKDKQTIQISATGTGSTTNMIITYSTGN